MFAFYVTFQTIVEGKIRTSVDCTNDVFATMDRLTRAGAEIVSVDFEGRV